MLIAHLPAGYLLTRGLLACLPPDRLGPAERRRLLIAGVLASILPDFDLAYHVLLDPANPHCGYWTHAPLFWVAAALTGWLLAAAGRRAHWHGPIGIVLANTLLHLALDSISGPVRWLYPFSDEYFRLIQVTRGPNGWLWSHLTHWTMLLELAITLGAAWVARFVPLRREQPRRMVSIDPYSLRGIPPARGPDDAAKGSGHLGARLVREGLVGEGSVGNGLVRAAPSPRSASAEIRGESGAPTRIRAGG